MADDIAADMALLEADKGTWIATPWCYSSLRGLILHKSGSGQLIYGYGQTIYALIKCHWQVVAAKRLCLTYQASPPFQKFQGYTPPDDQQRREFDFILTEGEFSGEEDILGRPFCFHWNLELSAPPWPLDLRLPHELPCVFFGHRQNNLQ